MAANGEQSSSEGREAALAERPAHAVPSADPREGLRAAEARALRAETALMKVIEVLRQAERLIHRLQEERNLALTRAAAAVSRAEAAEQRVREIAIADRTELDAAIIRASDALAELDEAQSRALDAEWRAARAEARVEQLLKATHLHTPAALFNEAGATVIAETPPVPGPRRALS